MPSEGGALPAGGATSLVLELLGETFLCGFPILPVVCFFVWKHGRDVPPFELYVCGQVLGCVKGSWSTSGAPRLNGLSATPIMPAENENNPVSN